MVAGAVPVIVAEEMTTNVVSVDAPYVLDSKISSSFMLGGPDHVSVDRQSVFWTDATSIFSKRY